MPQGEAAFGAAAVNGKIYAFGGYYYANKSGDDDHTASGEYDPATGTWTVIPDCSPNTLAGKL